MNKEENENVIGNAINKMINETMKSITENLPEKSNSNDQLGMIVICLVDVLDNISKVVAKTSESRFNFDEIIKMIVNMHATMKADESPDET